MLTSVGPSRAGEASAGEACFQVVVHPDNPAAEIEPSELARMFLKKTTQWPDGTPIQPVDQEPESPTRQQFSHRVLGRGVTSIKTYWQRLVFSGRDVPPPVLASDLEVLDFVRREPGAIGYVDCSRETPGVAAFDVAVDRERLSLAAADRPASARMSDPATGGETQVLRAFSLEHASARDVVNLLARGLQLTSAIEAGDDDLIFMRDTAARVEAAAKLIEAVDLLPAEVELDLELLLLEDGRAGAVADLFEATRGLRSDELERLRRAARRLAVTGLPAIDRHRARWWLSQELQVGAGGELTAVPGGLDLFLRPRIHAGGEVTLEVEANWIDAVRSDGEKPADASVNLEARSFTDAWQARLAPGEALVASGTRFLAGRRGVIAASLFGDGADGELVLVVTPRVIRQRELPDSELEIVCAAAGDSIERCGEAAPQGP